MDCTSKHFNARFIFGLTGNAKLNELYRFTIESAKREYNQYQKAVKRYHSLTFIAESRENHQRVILIVKVSIMGTNIRYIVTNLKEFRTRDLYEMGYCARVSIELCIIDHMLYLKSDQSPCTEFTAANQFRLFLHSMAYILIYNL